MNENETEVADKISVEEILSHYDLGLLCTVTPLTAGTVQTNLLIQTTYGRFVLRLYRQNRSFDAVRFEVDLINYLQQSSYPCPAVLRQRNGNYVGRYHEKPYALFAFLEGVHIEQPTAEQEQQLIQKVAELQLLTQHYRPNHLQARWNYDVPFCETQATTRAAAIGTANAREKLTWYRNTLAELHLPASHPKGICHGDFHFSNVLFKDGRFHALLDFDDANYTYLTFDLVSLIEPHLFRFQWDSWQTARPGDRDLFDIDAARKILGIYQAARPLQTVEEHHLFDLLKLATLIDCLWFFERGDADAFYERRKIECLDALGRKAFGQALFEMNS